MSLALCLVMIPVASFLVLKTHLSPIGCWRNGGSTSSQVPFASMDVISWSIAFLQYSCANACSKFIGSSTFASSRSSSWSPCAIPGGVAIPKMLSIVRNQRGAASSCSASKSSSALLGGDAKVIVEADYASGVRAGVDGPAASLWDCGWSVVITSRCATMVYSISNSLSLLVVRSAPHSHRASSSKTTSRLMWTQRAVGS